MPSTKIERSDFLINNEHKKHLTASFIKGSFQKYLFLLQKEEQGKKMRKRRGGDTYKS